MKPRARRPRRRRGEDHASPCALRAASAAHRSASRERDATSSRSPVATRRMSISTLSTSSMAAIDRPAAMNFAPSVLGPPVRAGRPSDCRNVVWFSVSSTPSRTRASDYADSRGAVPRFGCCDVVSGVFVRSGAWSRPARPPVALEPANRLLSAAPACCRLAAVIGWPPHIDLDGRRSRGFEGLGGVAMCGW